jgi:hypothetical protein
VDVTTASQLCVRSVGRESRSTPPYFGILSAGLVVVMGGAVVVVVGLVVVVVVPVVVPGEAHAASTMIAAMRQLRAAHTDLAFIHFIPLVISLAAETLTHTCCAMP